MAPSIKQQLRDWPATAKGGDGLAANDVAGLLDAAAARIDALEAALEPFAAAAALVATAAPGAFVCRFGFTADTFRRAREAYLGPAGEGR